MNIMIEADAGAVEVSADCASVLSSRGKKRKKSIVKWGEKKAISVVSYSCWFISLSIQTHRSPLNCFIEQ